VLGVVATLLPECGQPLRAYLAGPQQWLSHHRADGRILESTSSRVDVGGSQANFLRKRKRTVLTFRSGHTRTARRIKKAGAVIVRSRIGAGHVDSEAAVSHGDSGRRKCAARLLHYGLTHTHCVVLSTWMWRPRLRPASGSWHAESNEGCRVVSWQD
jgi:hypothetical protein